MSLFSFILASVLCLIALTWLISRHRKALREHTQYALEVTDHCKAGYVILVATYLCFLFSFFNNQEGRLAGRTSAERIPQSVQQYINDLSNRR